MKKLIAYFSRTGENYVDGTLKTLKVGNTEVVANMIKKHTDADVFKIVPVVSYSDDYNHCIAEAQMDQRKNARPELVSYPDSIAEYNVIYLGYPNYWGTMPMCVQKGRIVFPLKLKCSKNVNTHIGIVPQ